MRRRKVYSTLHRVKRPLFCCRAQESQSTIEGGPFSCPLHGSASPLDEALLSEVEKDNGTHGRAKPEIGDEKEASTKSAVATYVKDNRIGACLSFLAYKSTSPILRNIGQYFHRPQQDSYEPRRPLAIHVPGCMGLKDSPVVRDFDGGPLDSAQMQSKFSIHSLPDLGLSIEYGIASTVEIVAEVPLLSSTHGPIHACFPVQDHVTKVSCEDLASTHADRLHGFLRTVVFHDHFNQQTAFSSDLLTEDKATQARRRRLWRFAKRSEECKFAYDHALKAEDLTVLLKYDLVELSTSLVKASFASRIAVSLLIPDSDTCQPSAFNDDDLWLSMAEEELSSSESTSRDGEWKSRLEISALQQQEFMEQIATILHVHQLCFVVKPPKVSEWTYRLTHVTIQLHMFIRSDKEGFRRMVESDCHLQRQKFERNERFFFPFNYQSATGSICCIPIHQALQTLWFCILLKQPSEAGGSRRDTNLSLLAQNSSLNDISLIAVLQGG